MRLIIENIKCFEEKYPKRLLKIREYPQELYCVGNTSLLNSNKIVAIVGSRNCTDYGRKYAQIFASELAKRGVCIISGLAVGLDTSAHCGAMGEIGNTIAVLGGGLKNIYPRENLWLYNKILEEGGCIITEHEEHEETRTSNFPKRNRIIAGIADAVLIIEAVHRSGSKITAEYAKKQGKKIYCIPINLDQKNSSGINELLTEGAKIVTTPKQLMLDLYPKGTKSNIEKIVDNPRKYNKIIDVSEEYSKMTDVPKEYKEVYSVLENEMSVDEIAIKLNKDIGEINSMLTVMEIEGYIERIAGNNFKRRS